MVCLAGNAETQFCNTCTAQQATELQMPQHRPFGRNGHLKLLHVGSRNSFGRRCGSGNLEELTPWLLCRSQMVLGFSTTDLLDWFSPAAAVLQVSPWQSKVTVAHCSLAFWQDNCAAFPLDLPALG